MLSNSSIVSQHFVLSTETPSSGLCDVLTSRVLSFSCPGPHQPPPSHPCSVPGPVLTVLILNDHTSTIIMLPGLLAQTMWTRDPLLTARCKFIARCEVEIGLINFQPNNRLSLSWFAYLTIEKLHFLICRMFNFCRLGETF